MAAVQSIDVTAMARWVLAVHEDPELGDSHRIAVLLTWCHAIDVHGTDAALTAAREILAAAPQVTAYVPTL